jgi:hypothetical protein
MNFKEKLKTYYSFKTRLGITLYAWTMSIPIILLLGFTVGLINSTCKLIVFIIATFLCKINSRIKE